MTTIEQADTGRIDHEGAVEAFAERMLHAALATTDVLAVPSGEP